MLQSLYHGAKSGIIKIILLGFLLMAGLGLVLTDSAGFFRDGVAPNSIASVGNRDIPIRQFDQKVRQVVTRMGMNMEQAYQMGLLQQVLWNDVNNALLQQAAAKTGLTVSDAFVAKQLAKIIKPYEIEYPDMSKNDILQRMAQNQGLSSQGFVAQAKAELRTDMLKNSLSSGVLSPSKLVDDLVKVKLHTRDARAFLLKLDDIPAVNAPEDDILEKYLKSNSSNYVIPESRDISYIVIDDSSIKEKVSFSEGDIKATYDEDIDAYIVPKRQEIEQAILTSKNEADKLATALKKGRNFKKSVVSITGKDHAYLGRDRVEKSDLLDVVASAVSPLQEGEVADPVHTTLGWHVIKLIENHPERTKSFEEVRKSIEKQLKKDALEDSLYKLVTDIEDRTMDGTSLQEIADEFGLSIATAKGLKQTGKLAGGQNLPEALGNVKDIVNEIFSLEINIPGEVHESNSNFVVAQVDEISEAKIPELSTIRDTVLKDWTLKQRRSLLDLKAATILKELSETQDFKKAAIDSNSKIETFKSLDVDYDEKDNNILTASVHQRIFMQKSTGDFFAVTTPNGIVIGTIDAITIPTDVSSKSDRALVELATEEVMQQELVQDYISSLQQRYNVRVNEQAFKYYYGNANAEE